jgi:hypothetical protein
VCADLVFLQTDASRPSDRIYAPHALSGSAATTATPTSTNVLRLGPAFGPSRRTASVSPRVMATLGHILGDGQLSYQLTERVRSQLATRLWERVCVPRGARSVAATRQESMVRRPPARTTASFPPELESPRAFARSTPPQRNSTPSGRTTVDVPAASAGPCSDSDTGLLTN